jgi:glutaredoxin
MIELFGKELCSYCSRAKDLLAERDQKYVYFDVEKDQWAHSEMMRRNPGARTVPQIFIDGNLVGGYDDLRKMYKDQDAAAAAVDPNANG